ncbi:LysM peptidoglycan-binding domain-containing protein [Flavobacteriaceae bacterium]|nr:LysM peptidoglycan-binding domain-containing protein [Flavobacteriaceae bacterium]
MRRQTWVFIGLMMGLFLGPDIGHAQTQYEVFHVPPGVTIDQVLREYGMSYAELYAINPEVKTNFTEGLALVVAVSHKPLVFRSHRVKKRETLYGIAQKYHLAVDDLKAHNDFLSSRGIVKGDQLMIIDPKPIPTTNEVENIRANLTDLVVQRHSVRPKETLIGIARLYGLTLVEMSALNPGISDTLAIGQSLIIKKTPVASSAVLDQEFFYYQVLPREGFFRLKQKLGVSKAQIVALNPYAEQGLKLGMILKLPKVYAPQSQDDADAVDLRDFIRDSTAHRLSILLPFQLPAFTQDSLQLNEQLLQNNRTLRIALDFYSGVLSAAEEAQKYGMNVALEVHDTQGKSEAVRTLLAQSNFDLSDAIIGPLLSANLALVAEALKSSNVPVISPLSNRAVSTSQNIVQTLPQNELLEQYMIDYLQEHQDDKHILYIGEEGTNTQMLLTSKLPKTKILLPQEEGFIRPEAILENLSETQENWVVLSSSNPVIVSSVIGVLNGMAYYENQLSEEEDDNENEIEEPAKNYLVRLFTTDKNAAFDFDDITNLNLANLNFTFPSVSKPYALSDEDHAFLSSYKQHYGIYPNRFAVRGYDVTMDILLRLSQESRDLFAELATDFETRYIENKFRYQQNANGGFENKAYYLLRLNSDLEMVEVKGLDVVLERPETKETKEKKK